LPETQMIIKKRLLLIFISVGEFAIIGSIFIRNNDYKLFLSDKNSLELLSPNLNGT